ncbi:similar to Saccharomyces cerevisiae YER088C DOT6 Protein involved in rRNA and ribosome biogenesis [Maudiozyma saulgeensis]|uniref:Similar to Saccharomyces cerevisiae YER088C DOT6 Protein involved in rRNA and ribosome biogenesis n=1 Tax=Maudiozyma saulgeensis TaxID=1789683 RepID=A0A1X7QXT5_9SACH|nr:similar to Saccharomyces cerevisiae YER088C DOT6 Protein involved in rRNA and ribosome biogenesis [Kazachstania saulgeensis]
MQANPSNLHMANVLPNPAFVQPIMQLPYNGSMPPMNTTSAPNVLPSNMSNAPPHANIIVQEFSHETTRKSSVSSSSNNKILTKNPSSWDPMDDLLLRHLKEIQKMGWKEISQYFDNRTPNACQFRWRRLKSGNLKSNRTALIDVTEFPGKIEIKNKAAFNNVSTGRKRSTTKTKKNKSSTPATTTTNTSSTENQVETQPNTNVPHNMQNILNGNNATTILSKPITSANSSDSSGSTSPKGTSSISRESNTFQQVPPSILNLTAEPHISSNNETGIMRNGGIAIANPNLPVTKIPSAPISSFVDKFAKPRSYSCTPLPLARPAQQIHVLPVSDSQGKQLPLPQLQPLQASHIDKENVGFIPKVFVKSRRSSSIVPIAHGMGTPTSPQSLTPSSSHTDISAALNTTLNSSKSRKNSFTSWSSRRSSFNVSLSNGTSRRSSMVIPPNSASTIMGSSLSNQVAHLSKERRESIIKKEFITHHQNRQNSFQENPGNHNVIFPQQYTFSDIPAPSSGVQYNNKLSGAPKYAPKNLEQVAQLRSISNLSNYSTLSGSSIEHTSGKRGLYNPWTEEEEQLLMDSRSKNLSVVELSILLPNRTKEDIELRLNALSPNSLSNPLSPRKPLSVNQLAMQDEEVDPLHNHGSIVRPESLSSSSSSSVSKDTTPVGDSNDDSISTTPSSSTSVTASRTGHKNLLNNKISYKNVMDMGNLPPHCEGMITQQDYAANSASNQRSNSNAQLPSISSIFKTMI